MRLFTSSLWSRLDLASGFSPSWSRLNIGGRSTDLVIARLWAHLDEALR